MPTGYTAGVSDGTITTLEQFALTCARAFGSLILMRDDPLDADIPEFEPNTHSQEQADADTEEMKRVVAMNASECHDAAVKEYEDGAKAVVECFARKEGIRKRYEAMLELARAYTPPTKDHVGLAEFMVQQLAESIDFDCSAGGVSQPERKEADVWRDQRLARLAESIERHQKSQKEEVERTDQRNEWVASSGVTVNCEWQHDLATEVEEFGHGDELRIWAGPGEHWLACRVTVIDWEARTFESKIDRTSFVVGAVVPPEPGPDPPTPDPDIVPGKKFVIIVYETLNPPQWLVRLVNDFRSTDGVGAKYLVESGLELYFVDPNSVDANGNRSKYLAMLDSSPRGDPALYVLDDKTKKVIGSNDLPKTTPAVIALIKSFGG